MSSNTSKNIGIAAGIAVSSFIAGGLVSRLFYSNTVECTPPNKDSSEESKGKMVNKNKRFLDDYVCENSLREPVVLKELREHTLAEYSNMVKMLTNPIQAQFIRLLLNMLDAKKCIEVGAFTGYNVLNCALSIPDDGVIYALDVNEDYVKQGYQFFEKANVRNKIQVKIGAASESLDQLIMDGHTETIDFVYIDADKLNYGDYLERALVLLRIGGVVALDNTLQHGRVSDLTQEMKPGDRPAAEYMHKLNQKIKLDNRFQLSFLNIADGLTICRKI